MGGRNKSGHDGVGEAGHPWAGGERRVRPMSPPCLPPRPASLLVMLGPRNGSGGVPGTHGRRHPSRPAALRAEGLHGWPEQVRP